MNDSDVNYRGTAYLLYCTYNVVVVKRFAVPPIRRIALCCEIGVEVDNADNKARVQIDDLKILGYVW